MNLSSANIIQIGMYLIAIGTFVGVVKQQFTNIQNQLDSQKEQLKSQLDSQKEQLTIQISGLDKKVEKHNHVIERMYKCEESIKSLHKRVDEIREDK